MLDVDIVCCCIVDFIDVVCVFCIVYDDGLCNVFVLYVMVGVVIIEIGVGFDEDLVDMLVWLLLCDDCYWYVYGFYGYGVDYLLLVFVVLLVMVLVLGG